MPNWYWIVFLVVGIVCYYLILKLQKVAKWIAILIGIAEAILAYILSVAVFEMRIHPAEIKTSTYVIAFICAALMVALFFIKGKKE